MTTVTRLVSRLEELIGELEEYDGYIDVQAAEVAVRRLKKLVQEAGEAQESDHEDDESSDNEDDESSDNEDSDE
jgi:hypothetical protein